MARVVQHQGPAWRRSERTSVQIECDVLSELWDEPVELAATDISPHGMWLESPLPLSVGDSLAVVFQLPSMLRPFVFVGNVRRVKLSRRAGDMDRSGMGIEFRDIPKRVLIELGDALCDYRPPVATSTAASTGTWHCPAEAAVASRPLVEATDPAADVDFEPLSEVLTNAA